jgi:hypothetical protein
LISAPSLICPPRQPVNRLLNRLSIRSAYPEVVYGAQPNVNLGAQLAVVEDINQDGMSDLAVTEEVSGGTTQLEFRRGARPTTVSSVRCRGPTRRSSGAGKA